MGIYRKPKSPYWWADVSVAGRPRVRFSTGTTDRIEAQKVHDRERAKLWNTPTEIERSSLLSAWVIKWCSVEGRSLSDIQSMGKFMKHYQDRLIADVVRDTAALDKAMRSFIKTPSTYTRYRARIHAVLEMARKEGAIASVPALPEWRVGRNKKPVAYLKDKNALDDLIRHLPAHQKPMVLFATFTGMRQANVLNLRWDHVDLERRIAWVDAAETKAGRAITIPLNNAAVKVLEGQLGIHETYVFTYRGRTISEIKRGFIDACVAAGLGTLTVTPDPQNKDGVSRRYKGLRWHDLRHTFASWHAMRGTPPQVIQVLGGWASMKMLENYTHLAPSFVATHAENIT